MVEAVPVLPTHGVVVQVQRGSLCVGQVLGQHRLCAPPDKRQAFVCSEITPPPGTGKVSRGLPVCLVRELGSLWL